MKRNIISAAALLAAAALIVTLGFALRRPSSPQPVPEAATQAVEPAQPYQFLLKIQRESLELFHIKDGRWQKLADFPVTVDDLPEADKQLLKTGIVLKDAQELQRSLEDYLPNA